MERGLENNASKQEEALRAGEYRLLRFFLRFFGFEQAVSEWRLVFTV